MRVSLTFSKYISKHILVHVAVVLLALTGLVMLIDLIELLRRASKISNVPFSIMLSMTLLKGPSMAEQLLPYAALLGSMLALVKLTRTQELVIARAAGVSVWQFLLPALLVVGAMAVFFVTVLNPLSAVMLLKNEKLEARYYSNQPSLMALAPSGIWLKQIEDYGEYIVHAQRLNQADMTFQKVMVLRYDKQYRFADRLDADSAQLRDDLLIMNNAIRAAPGTPPEVIPLASLPTTLKLEKIQDSFASPEAMPFWGLPGFIHTLEEAGFSALKHRMYLHSLLATPFLMMGMVLVAAIFSLRLSRQGKLLKMGVFGMIAGFSLYFLTQLVHALGGGGTLPITLAAWAPALIVLSIGAAGLLHLEDG